MLINIFNGLAQRDKGISFTTSWATNLAHFFNDFRAKNHMG